MILITAKAYCRRILTAGKNNLTIRNGYSSEGCALGGIYKILTVIKRKEVLRNQGHGIAAEVDNYVVIEIGYAYTGYIGKLVIISEEDDSIRTADCRIRCRYKS